MMSEIPLGEVSAHMSMPTNIRSVCCLKDKEPHVLRIKTNFLVLQYSNVQAFGHLHTTQQVPAALRAVCVNAVIFTSPGVRYSYKENASREMHEGDVESVIRGTIHLHNISTICRNSLSACWPTAIFIANGCKQSFRATNPMTLITADAFLLTQKYI